MQRHRSLIFIKPEAHYRHPKTSHIQPPPTRSQTCPSIDHGPRTMGKWPWTMCQRQALHGKNHANPIHYTTPWRVKICKFFNTLSTYFQQPTNIDLTPFRYHSNDREDSTPCMQIYCIEVYSSNRRRRSNSCNILLLCTSGRNQLLRCSHV
jgi:hypothetical protein